MIRSLLAALLLASPLNAQVVSVKTTVPVLTGAPGVVAFQAPALSAGVAVPTLAASLAPSLVPVLAPAIAVAPAAAAVPVAAIAVAASPAKAINPLRAAVSNFGEKLAQAPKALLGLFDGSAAVGDVSEPVAAAAAASPVRPLASIKQLKVGTYNLLNLFENVGKHVPDPGNPGKLVKISDAKPKEEWSLRAQGKVILDSDLDIVTLEEVENIAALSDFNERYLDGKYKVFLIEGNDERGIDVAFLVKRDLPLAIEHRSHKEETWVDPVFGGGPTKLFSRDLTSLVVRAEPGGKPLFVLFGTHFKSKRDRDGRDPESRIMRGAQVQRAAEIIGRYRQEFGADVPVMLAGDFNGEVPNEPEFKPLFEAAGLTDSFDASPNPPSDKDRITHTFHPKGGASKYGQMDAVLVSKGLRGAVSKAEVYRYKNPDGSVRAIPKTYEEREKNPSDHFPVIVTLDFAPIRESFVPDWKAVAKPQAKPDEGLEEFAAEHLKESTDAVLRGRVEALTKAYMSAEKPERLAAYLLSTAYYDGFEAVARAGLTPEIRRQLETMLAVLETIMPRAKARLHREAEINRVINTFEPMLGSFDRRGQPPPPSPIKRSPAQDARDFADAAQAWLAASGDAFDAKNSEWARWTENPGAVNTYTSRNLGEIRRRIDALQVAKNVFVREAAAVPAGSVSPEKVRRLYDAWDRLRAAGADALVIVADSFDADLSKRGLMANIDQNSGRHPGGLEIFLSPGLTVDWDGARALNEALRR
ncbi:MAG: hypothetical protein HY923_08810 [Elusimicrobia bacterium]|nr:hypothetical protein [Elusimicrobiota bacterium]